MFFKRLFKPIEAFDLIAFTICSITFLLWLYLLTLKYTYFGYYDWDLAFYSQICWNLTKGSLYSSLFGMNFLANHAEYISFLVVPLYHLFPSPLTLIYLKVFSFCAAGYVLYLIAKKNIPPGFAVLLTFLYLTYPANIYAMLFEFHFESLGILLLTLLFYFFRENRFLPFCMVMILTSLVKENMPPVIVAFGIYALFSKREAKGKWALVPILWGLGVFYLTMFVITPALRTQEGIGSANQYLGMYHNLGSSPIEILKTFLLKPWKVFEIIRQPNQLRYLTELLRPLLFLPLYSPHILFLASPLLLQHLLSAVWTQKTIYYHYAATLTPFLFFAAIEFLRIIRFRIRKIFYKIVFVLLTATSLYNLTLYRQSILERISWFEDILDPIREQMVRQIPSQGGVIATFQFLPKLSNRTSLYSFLNVLTGNDGYSNRPFRLPDEVSYMLVDFNDPWVRNTFKMQPQESKRRLKAFIDKGNWFTAYAREDIVLFKRGETNAKN